MELKIDAGKILHTSKCWTCGASNKNPRNWIKKGRGGFTIHHLEYRNGEKMHSDFPKTLKG